MSWRIPFAFRSVAPVAVASCRAAAAFGAALVVSTGTAGGVAVSGQVTDEQGFGIFNADLDFEDRDTGQIIF
ncbi:MAG TPA: hypothetical protein VKU85_20505, partial [bacterium]|nr:hypothetical protein [bacterium]